MNVFFEKNNNIAIRMKTKTIKKYNSNFLYAKIMKICKNNENNMQK